MTGLIATVRLHLLGVVYVLTLVSMLFVAGRGVAPLGTTPSFPHLHLHHHRVPPGLLWRLVVKKVLCFPSAQDGPDLGLPTRSPRKMTSPGETLSSGPSLESLLDLTLCGCLAHVRGVLLGFGSIGTGAKDVENGFGNTGICSIEFGRPSKKWPPTL